MLRQIGRDCGIAMNAALRSVSQLTFPAPHRAEICFSAEPHSGRRVVEEHRSQIEAVLERYSGQSVTVSFRVSQDTADDPAAADTENTPAAAPEPSTPPEPRVVKEPQRQFVNKPERPATVENVDLVNQLDPLADGFVRQVSEVFGGKVVKVMPAPELAQQQPDEGQSAPA